MDITTFLMQSIEWKYTLSTIMATFFILSRVIHNPSKIIKVLVSFIVSIGLGIIWYYYLKTTIDILIISFLFSNLAYNWGIKTLMGTFGNTYSNNKGLKLK